MRSGRDDSILGAMRQDIVDVVLRRSLRNLGLILIVVSCSPLVLPSDVIVAALAVFLASTLISAVVWPIYLRSRIRSLSEDDAVAFRAAAQARRGMGLNGPTAGAALITIGAPAVAYLINPLLAVIVIGWATGVQLAVLWWCRTAPTRAGKDALDGFISGLAITKPNHRMFAEP
jgi:hypothetical protein